MEKPPPFMSSPSPNGFRWMQIMMKEAALGSNAIAWVSTAEL